MGIKKIMVYVFINLRKQTRQKGRVSVPASFRSYLSNLGYNGVICYPSFNNQSIEAWPQDRIEKISNTIDSLNPFEEKRDFFATSVLSKVLIYNLMVKEEFH